MLLAINHYKTTESLNGISLIQYTSIIISFYCSLISRDDFQTRIICEFSSCYYSRSIYASAPTSDIFISQASVQQILVDSAFVSGQSVSFMELHRYIIMRSQMVIVPFALYVCAMASSEKMSSGNADTAFVSNCDHTGL